MTTLLQEYEAPIADFLQQYATGVRALGDAGWEFTLPGEVPLLVTARLKKGWLRLSLAVERTLVKPPYARNPGPHACTQYRSSGGGAKFTLADDPPLPCLAAEILLDEEQPDLARENCAGVRRLRPGLAGVRR